VLEVSTFTSTRTLSTRLLADGVKDNVLVKIAPDLNQALFQFISTLDVCTVNTYLNGYPYLIVNWVEVWTDRGQKSSLVCLLSTQQFDSFTSTMYRCTVLLKRILMTLL